MEERKGTAATRAKNKYNAANYDRLYPYVKLGKKAIYQKAVNVSDFESMNEFIESAADERAAAILGLTPEQYEEAVKAAADEARKKR